jgi:tight adherence protein B
MVFVLATFVIVLAIILGIYWLMLVRPETAEESAVLARVGGTTKAAKTAALLKAPQRLSDMHSLDYLLARAGRVVQPLQRSLDQSGLNLTLGTIVLASALIGALAFYLVHTFLHLVLVAAVVGVLAACMPFGFVRYTRTRRLLKFEEQFPEAIDLLSRALRAGHAITTGLSMVAEELPAPIGPEFQTLYDQQNFGLPLSQALKSFADRVVILDARFFVTAVLTQKEAGGNLSEVLDNLATIIRERFKVKRQVRVISAHGRITGWVLSALPASLGLFFAISNPEKYASFYGDPLGMQLIGGALFLQLVGVCIIKKIVNIEY